jgi:hypothetical protein
MRIGFRRPVCLAISSAKAHHRKFGERKIRDRNTGALSQNRLADTCGENFTVSPDLQFTQATANYLPRETASQSLA